MNSVELLDTENCLSYSPLCFAQQSPIRPLRTLHWIPYLHGQCNAAHHATIVFLNDCGKEKTPTRLRIRIRLVASSCLRFALPPSDLHLSSNRGASTSTPSLLISLSFVDKDFFFSTTWVFNYGAPSPPSSAATSASTCSVSCATSSPSSTSTAPSSPKLTSDSVLVVSKRLLS